MVGLQSASPSEEIGHTSARLPSYDKRVNKAAVFPSRCRLFIVANIVLLLAIAIIQRVRLTCISYRLMSILEYVNA